MVNYQNNLSRAIFGQQPEDIFCVLERGNHRCLGFIDLNNGIARDQCINREPRSCSCGRVKKIAFGQYNPKKRR